MTIPEKPTYETKLTKLITNQFIIGKTSTLNKITTITQPFMVIPDPNGIQIFPYDEAIIGKKLEKMTIANDNIMYSTEVGQELQNLYLTTISGIETSTNNKLILG